MSLFGSFMRSASDQVGRDAGRVLSNQIFGNAHATPIRIVEGVSHSYRKLPPEQSQLDTNYKEIKEYIPIKWFWAAFLSLIIPMIGGLIIFFRGVTTFNRAYMMAYIVEPHEVYEKRQFSAEKQFVGHKNIHTEVKVDISPRKKVFQKIKCFGYMFIGAMSLVIYYYVFTDPNLSAN